MRWASLVPVVLRGITGAHVLLGCSLALGAWVRFSGLDLGWFVQDQARDATIALGIVNGRNFPLMGPMAGGTFHLGPLFYYLLTIPYGLSPNPLVGLIFQTSLNLLSIYLAYHLGKEMFGSTVGLVGAALYAVFPSAVLSGRALWNPGFIPVCTTLFLVVLWHALVRSRAWMFALLLPLLGAILQLHASTIIFVALFPIALVVYRPPLSLRALLIGALCLALLYAPLLIVEAQQGFPDVRNLLRWGQKALSADNLQPFWFIAWRGFWVPFLLPLGLATALPEATLPSLFTAIQWAELVVLMLGLLILSAQLVKAKDRRPYLMLAFWFALPFLVFPHLQIAMPWYYFDVLYPAQFLVIGLLTRFWLDAWPETRSRWRPDLCLRSCMYVLVGVFVVAQVWFTLSFDKAVRRWGVLRGDAAQATLPSPPGLRVPVETMPLRFKLALAELFLSGFGVGHATLEKVAHGAVYQQFREDKGYSFLVEAPRQAPSPLDPSLHYVLLRSWAEVTLNQGRELRSEPYRIIAYHPTIQYESWKWSVNPGHEWSRETFDDSTWGPLNLPVRQVPDRSSPGDIPATQWPGRTVTFRGWMEGPQVNQQLWLILNIRDHLFSPHMVEALYLNGKLLASVRTIPYDSFTAHNVEVMVDVTSALRPGPNLVAFQITGPNEFFDLDVYELQLAVNEAD